jgi:hypothetical protein
MTKSGLGTRYSFPHIRGHASNIIRLVARVFVTDCMNTLFFKSPPQITVAEMCADLPSTDAIFATSDDAEFKQLVATSAHFQPRTRSLKDVVALFLHDDWEGLDSLDLAPLDVEHLTTIMFSKSCCLTTGRYNLQRIAFHSVIFVSRTTLLMPSTYQILLRAIDRWKDAWYHVHSRTMLVKRRLIGFVKYSLELWRVAQNILQVVQRGDSDTAYMHNKPTDSLQELHDFIKYFVG